mmetsp:Transcript_19495/g.49568  ORF Transcript_19495/g.49568 Transcript_19495/m.49568 type:complete len:319 (+) Transcript_19495:3-959(+)
MLGLLLGFCLGVAASVVALLAVLYAAFTTKTPQPPHAYPPATPDAAHEDVDTRTRTRAYDWVNSVADRVFKELLADRSLHATCVDAILTAFRTTPKPNFVGDLAVRHLDFGKTLPHIIFSSAQCNAGGDLVVRLGLRYHGGASITIATQTWLNWPVEHVACLPLSVCLGLRVFTGMLEIRIPCTRDPVVTLSFPKRPYLKWGVGTLIGAQRKLRNIPAIEKFLVDTLEDVIASQIVSPHGFSLHIPVLGRALDLQAFPGKPQNDPESGGAAESAHQALRKRTLSSSTGRPHRQSTPGSVSSSSSSSSSTSPPPVAPST